MTTQVQINRDVKFLHNEELLAKAETNKPMIQQTKREAVGLVMLQEDQQALSGWGMAAAEQKIAELSSMPVDNGESFILDFGDHYVGSFGIDIDSVGSPMDAPLYLRLRFAEVPAELAANSEDYDGWLSRSWIQEEFIHLDELPYQLVMPRRYSFRYVEIKVIATSPKWQAVFSNPYVISETSATTEALPQITVADPELQRIYDVSVKTLEDCMQDVFEDGPKRDRRLWLGDLRLQALANYSTFGDLELVKRCLYLFAGMTTEEGKITANVFVKPRPIQDDTFLFDYSLFFISSVYDYQQFTHDRELLADVYSVMKKQMDLSLAQMTAAGEMQFTADYPVFIDWSSAFDKTTAGQAITIYALKQFITLTETMKKDASAYQEALDKLIHYAQHELFDHEQQLFVSGEAREYNIASQVWMVLAGVFSQEQNQQIMTATLEQLFPITGIATPYMYHHVVQALFEADLADDAIQLMKTYWGKMIEMGADTFWEAFDPNDPNYSPYGSTIISSYCHAWSCTPAYLIQKYLLN
ncbi:alpha-L-rhamnosidase-related protein [Enterococcus sp. AZ109]|uniref:alpha-L-rhamnosidase-related protein n=1 Tax=Enterococcus sp. AZ109 TaxID=2774634 RepID=UPI003F26F46F